MMTIEQRQRLAHHIINTTEQTRLLPQDNRPSALPAILGWAAVGGLILLAVVERMGWLV